MQIRKIYSIVIILFITSFSARAESVAQSLEKLIERNKVTAIRLAKEYIKVHLRDSLKEYKNQLKRLDKLTFRYVPDISLRKEARNYDGQASVYSIIDNTTIKNATVQIEKEDSVLLTLNIFDGRICYYKSYSADYGGMIFKLKRAKEKKQKFSIDLLAFEAYIEGDSIYLCKYKDWDSEIYTIKELESDFRSYNIRVRLRNINHNAYIKSYLEALSDSSYKPLGRINLTYLQAKYDSIKEIYLNKYKNDSTGHYLQTLVNIDRLRDNIQNLKTLGFSLDQVLGEPNNLSFKVFIKLKLTDSIKCFRQYDDIIKYSNIESFDKSDVHVMVFFKGEKIGFIDNNENIICIHKEYIFKESFPWEYDDSELYLNVDLASTFLFSVDNKFFISSTFSRQNPIDYRNFPRHSIPYEQYLEQVLDEYYVRTVYGSFK